MKLISRAAPIKHRGEELWFGCYAHTQTHTVITLFILVHNGWPALKKKSCWALAGSSILQLSEIEFDEAKTHVICCCVECSLQEYGRAVGSKKWKQANEMTEKNVPYVAHTRELENSNTTKIYRRSVVRSRQTWPAAVDQSHIIWCAHSRTLLYHAWSPSAQALSSGRYLASSVLHSQQDTFSKKHIPIEEGMTHFSRES